MDVAQEKQLVSEGKTKQIWTTPGDPYSVLIVSKDKITAEDGRRSDDLPGKAQISNSTACKVFTLLKDVGNY